MFINGREFKPYDDYYYVSEDGDVWSKYINRCLKHSIDTHGYHRVDIHEQHMQIHKLVYLTWIGDIPKGMQVNHKDDNKENNNYQNLYLGTQKENIRDCINNNHRVGNAKRLVVLEKSTNKILTFQPASLFFEYSGHSAINKNITRAVTRDWFKENYVLISLEKGVTTKSKTLEQVGKG